MYRTCSPQKTLCKLDNMTLIDEENSKKNVDHITTRFIIQKSSSLPPEGREKAPSSSGISHHEE